MLSPKLILSPIDFSDFSVNALDTATDLAKRYGSEILLLHVVPVIPSLPEAVSMFQEGSYEHELIENAKQQLSELSNKLQQAGVKSRTTVGLANDAAMEIVRTASAERADLIVIATHGTTGWRRIAFGSVAEKVVSEAECPVLLLRAKATAESAESEQAQAQSA